MENKNVSKAKVQKYVDLYLYIKGQMAQPDWRNVTEHLHKNKAYKRFIEVYTDFVKDFESAERGYLKNQGVHSARELTDVQIEHLSSAFAKLEAKGSMKNINLALGSTFGEGAGREKALVSVLVSEGRYHALENELKKAKGKAEAVREISSSMENARQDFATQLSTLTEAITASQNSAQIEALDKKSQRILTEQNNLRQTVLSEIGAFGGRLEQIEQNQYAQMMQVEAFANAQANQPQTQVKTDLTPVLDQFYLAQQATDKTIGKATGKAIATTRDEGRKTREAVTAEGERTREAVMSQGKATINSIRSEGRQTRTAIADLESKVNRKGPYIWAGAATAIATAAIIGLILTGHSYGKEKDKRISLENANAGYTTQITEVVGENSQIKGENAQLKDENTQLKGENAQIKGENTQLKDENTQLKTDINSEESKRHDAENRANEAENMYATLNADYSELKALYEELKNKPSDTASLEKYVNLCAKFNGNLAEVIKTGTFSEIEKLQVLSLVTDMSAMEESLGVKNHPWANELVGEVFNLGVNVSKFANEITELNSKIANLEAVIEDYKKNPQGEISKVEYEQAVKAKEQAEAERDALSASLAEYKATHTMSDENVKADKEATKKEYENTIANKEATISGLQSQLDELNRLFNEYKASNPTKAELDELTQKYNTEKAKLEKKIETLEADKNTIQNSYDAYKTSTSQQMQTLNNKVSSLETKVNDLNKQIEEMENNKEGISQSEYNKVVAERDSLKQQLNTAKQNLTDTQTKLNVANQNITNTKTELSNLQKTLDSYKANHNYTDAQYNAINKKLSDVQAQYNEAVKKLEEATNDTELKKALAELETYRDAIEEACDAIGLSVESGKVSVKDLEKMLSALGVQINTSNTSESNSQNNSQRGE